MVTTGSKAYVVFTEVVSGTQNAENISSLYLLLFRKIAEKLTFKNRLTTITSNQRCVKKTGKTR